MQITSCFYKRSLSVFISVKKSNTPSKLPIIIGNFIKLQQSFQCHEKQVKAGNEVLITDRGKPMARLAPISRTKTARESPTRMEKQGLIKIGSGRLPKKFWTLPRAEDTKGFVLKAVLNERSSGTNMRPREPSRSRNCLLG
jgi:antitoxin (DNA-binding transcriptional repressor) of toxin-antitoxin stability system